MTSLARPARKARPAIDPGLGRGGPALRARTEDHAPPASLAAGPAGGARAGVASGSPRVSGRCPAAGTILAPGAAASLGAPFVGGPGRRRPGPVRAAGARRLSFARKPLDSHKTRKYKFQKTSTSSTAGRGGGAMTARGSCGSRLDCVETRPRGPSPRLATPLGSPRPSSRVSRGPARGSRAPPEPAARRPPPVFFCPQPVEITQNAEI
jgi:hypothetical protein